MKTLTIQSIGFILSSMLTFGAIGCHIITNEPCGDSGMSYSGDGPDLCKAMCDRLLTCRSISTNTVDECQASCQDEVDADPSKTEAIRCVIDDACHSLSSYACPGAPLPGGGAGAGGASSTGGTSDVSTVSSSVATGSSGGGGAAPGSCKDNHDCAANEDCIQGACLSRCSASCECAKGESCTDGYCHQDMPAPPACQVSCDCPKGMACVSGVCE